jgi:DNA-nicking Smr family endonuclease
MAARIKPLTEADKAVWEHFARLIAPLPGRRPAAPPADAPPPAAVLPPLPRPAPAARPVAAPLAINDASAGLDSASWQRFRQGKVKAMRRLDLHGMTTQHAFHALIAFLRSAHADRLRCVEVVTGRGSAEGGTGSIRREFPLWLNLPAIRPLVLAAAHPHPANPGSVRLLLRRIR